MCVHTCAVTCASAGLPCGGCLSFNPESPGITMMKSEVCIILTMVYYNIFSINNVKKKGECVEE